MARLTHVLALLAALWAFPAAAAGAERWQAQIAEAAHRFGVPGDLIGRVIEAESGGRAFLAGRPITSRAGAMGLMQLMPETWEEMRQRYRLGSNPHEPRDNILAGTAYLRAMLDRFGFPGALAAYNAGPARYRAYLTGGGPLPQETRLYLRKVARLPSAPSAPMATAGASPGAIARLPVQSPAAAHSLFAILKDRGPALPPAPDARGLIAIRH